MVVFNFVSLWCSWWGGGGEVSNEQARVSNDPVVAGLVRIQ